MSFYEDSIKDFRSELQDLINDATLNTKWQLGKVRTSMPDRPVLFVYVERFVTNDTSHGKIFITDGIVNLSMIDFIDRHSEGYEECEEFICEQLETLLANICADTEGDITVRPGYYKKKECIRVDMKIKLYGG